LLAESLVACSVGAHAALHAHQDKPTLDPWNLSQWEFYVLPTGVLDRPLTLESRVPDAR
jgi:hypothetical protein